MQYLALARLDMSYQSDLLESTGQYLTMIVGPVLLYKDFKVLIIKLSQPSSTYL
jgi:hypothetical protein